MERRSPNHAVPQLSCELCRERKVKCDKLTPCTHCVSAGVACVPVYRLRLPRGRHVHRSVTVDEDLKRRIRRLEALISSGGKANAMSGGVGQSSADSEHQDIAPAAPSRTSSDLGSSTGPDKRALLVQRPDHFWEDLAEEIYGLRNIIESTPNEAEDDSVRAPEASQTGSTHRSISFLGLSGSSNSLNVPPHFDISHNKVLANQLGEVYLRQVDPVIKFLHRPSLGKLMLQSEGYLRYPDGHPSVDVLKSAVMYSAANSLTENQCRTLFSTSQSTLQTDCRRACEDALERAGLLTTRDITVLQAFVLYLSARRSEERSRAVWTLLSLAVRIAKGLSLNIDPEDMGRHESFYFQQMRRRLWLTICLMDVQNSFGLTSQPLIALEEAISSSKLPAHVNDSDFDLTTSNKVPDREGLTETTFAIVKYKLQLLGRLTNFGPEDQKSHSSTDGDDNTAGTSTSTHESSDVQVRQEHVRRFEQDILQLLHLCNPETSTYAWLTFNSAQCYVAGARACALRPLQRLREGSQPPPPRLRGDTELLSLGTQLLEKANLVHTDPRGEGFRWYVTIPWHALAITIAECYICTDVDLIRNAWPTVEASYRLHESSIAKLRGEKLHGPLGKLMRRTREKLAPILLSINGAEDKSGVAFADSSAEIPLKPASRSDAGPSEILADSLGAASISPPRILQHSQQTTSSSSPFLGNQNSMGGLLSLGSQASTAIKLDQSWGIWEEFVSDISFDDFTSPDIFFSESYLNGS